MDTDAPTFALGTVIGEKYRLDRELGRGGMGTVYQATNVVLEVPVAIKVLHVGANPSPNHARRFLQEARAAAAVRHANIVRIVDFGQDAATRVLYLVQEFLQGRDLKTELRARGPMPPAEAIELLLPVMRALSWAHGRGVVHRDLKPDNIFLEETPDGRVPKIIDFGIAKVVDGDGQSAQNTATGAPLGTPYFMSPEQTRGDRAVDLRTDIWALGVVLYHLLTGRYPHEGATVNLVMASIITRQPRPVTDFAPALPSPVVALLDGALRYEPAERYPSMDAFWNASRECLAALGVAVAPAPTPAPVAASMPSPERVSSQPKPATPADLPTVAPQVMATQPATAPRLRSLAVMVVAGLAFTAALGGYWSGRGQPSSASTSPQVAASPAPAPRTVVPPRPTVTPVAPRPVVAAALAARPTASPAVAAPPPPPPVAPPGEIVRTPNHRAQAPRGAQRPQRPGRPPRAVVPWVQPPASAGPVVAY